MQSTRTSYGQWRRDGRSNCLVAPPTLHRAVPPELHILHTAMWAGLQITRLTALSEQRTCDLRNTRPTHCLCGHSLKEIVYHDSCTSFVHNTRGHNRKYTLKYHIPVSELLYLNKNKIGDNSNFVIYII